jgi:hypothetical protein
MRVLRLIVRPNEIKRELDAEFISELVIGMLNGIKQKDQEDIDVFYKKYDQTFSELDDARKDFFATERLIQDIFGDDLAKTRWRGKRDFYSLFLAIYELAKVYNMPSERYDEMKKRLEEFAYEVDVNIGTSEKEREKSSSLVRECVENVEKRSTHESSRQKRYDAAMELLIPFLIARDTRRGFNDEERGIAWVLSPTRDALSVARSLHGIVTHLTMTPHREGGKTELSNSEITHKVCNIKKSDKTS